MSNEAEARAPSEAFPQIPKAVLQRRADSKHRPFRPSPLSGKSPMAKSGNANNSFQDTEEAKDETSTPNVSAPSEEEEKSTSESGDEARRKSNKVKSSDAASILMLKAASSESESEKKKELTDEPDDEIARLGRLMDNKIKELHTLEKRLLETEANVRRLLEVYKKETHVKQDQERAEVVSLRKKVIATMNELKGIVDRTVQKRDLEIDKQTTQMVDIHLSRADEILRHLDFVAADLELQRATSTMWWLKSVAILFLSTILAFTSLLMILVMFSDEEDTQWIIGPLRSWGNALLSKIKESR